MNNPIRSIFINHSNQKLILRFQINILLNTLVLNYTIHELLKNGIVGIVENTLKNNPENDIVSNNSIPTKLVYSPTDNYNINQVQETVSNIENLLKKSEENTNIKVTIFGSTLFIPYSRLYMLCNFLKGFVINYDTIKLSLLNPKTEKEPEESKDKEITITIEDDDILNEILNKTSPNKIINYNIVKWINNNNINNDSLYIDIDDNTRSIFVKVQELFDFELFGYSINNTKELENLLDFVDPKTKPDNILKIKILFGFFNNLMFNINNENKIETTTYMQVITFLIFLYGVKLFYPNIELENIDLKECYTVVINSCFSNILKKYKLEKYDNISVEFFKNDNQQQDKINNISKISEKYKHLLKIDESIFLDKVIENDIQDNYQQEKKKNIISSPKSININNFIDKGTSGMLFYSKIDTKKYNFGNRIITPEYFNILIIENGRKIQKHFKDNHLIVKFSDIIINHIFPEINNNIKYSISTLIIINKYIEPFIPKETSEKVKRELLYRIIIPHLYNVYKVENILDYFY